MNNVKNNHDAPLAVAGVTIAPGSTVGINSDTLRGALGSNGVKQWIKLGVIEVEGLSELSETVVPGIPSATPVRDPKSVKKIATPVRDPKSVKKIAESAK